MKDLMKEQKETKKNPKAKSNTALYVGSVIVFILIFISFIILPGMVQGAGRGIPVFGKWNKKEIKYEADSYFNQCLSVYGNQIKDSGNYNEAFMEFMMKQAFQQAFNETVRRYAFIDFVKSTGYTVSDNSVDRKMLPNFYDATGKFNEKIYRDTPDSRKAALRKSYEEDNLYFRFIQDYFPEDVVGQTEGITYSLGISDNEVSFLNQMNAVAKSFDVAIFSTDRIPDSEAIAYANENPQLFGKYYFKAISVESLSAAKKILSQLKSEQVTFEDALSEYSKNYYTATAGDGELKNIFRYQIENTLNKKEDFSKLEKLEIDQYSPVIKTKTGYTIFRCYDNTKELDLSDAETLEIIKTYLKENEMGRVQDYFMNSANAFHDKAKAEGFDAACGEFDVSRRSVYNFNLNYDNSNSLDIADSDVDVLSDVSKNEDFLTTLFSLKQDEISKPIVLDKAIVLLKSNSDSASPSKTFEKADCISNNFNQDYSTMHKSIFESKKLKNYFDATYAKFFTSKKE